MTTEEIKTFMPQLMVDVEECPVIRTLELLNGRWTAQVIYQLEKYETIRFGELKKQLQGITNTMLSNTLKNLEEKSIIKRIQYDEMPVRVEYSLTEMGGEMLPIFYEMSLWGTKYLKKADD
ncbi:winged helix-turn-helix transcriptional regulator [Lacrimispora sp.]|uniref:winged helix-turn-helix transcriptional regulator n=1 Tax=Lacrimispora sp. TaxID=2719234 RepID=UPI0028AA7331|nr:helix-turn-helix domain-containing protein [Lacrimispora sp.]